MATDSWETKLVRCASISNPPNQSVYLNYPRKIKLRSNCEDRISWLPDDILLHILSSLKDIKEATRTSVLSKKWQHLWCNLPNYDFTNSLVLPGYKKNVVSFKFVCCVDKVVSFNLASSINRFKVRCELGARYSLWIYEWMSFAMTKSVKELELNFLDFESYPCEIPATLPSLRHYADCPSLHTLVSLTLGGLCVTTDFLELLLFNFTNLEHLVMSQVFCVESEFKGLGCYKKNMKTKVAGSLLKLRHLELSLCQGFGEIEISAEKLTSLVYYAYDIEDIKFSYVPLLNDATFRGRYTASFICNLGIISGFSSQLSRLKLVTRELEKIIQRPLVVPKQFGNLKELDLMIIGYPTESLLLVTNFIDACPLLHKLKLQRELPSRILKSVLEKWNWKESRDDVGYVAVKHHRCLNIFEMVGFLGAKVDIELILVLAQEAIPLEKIILDPNQRCYEGKLTETEPPDLAETVRKGANLLRNHIPSRVKIEVL